MIKFNVHRPDSCECVLVYSWDNSVPVEQRVHTPVASAPTNDGGTVEPIPCEFHSDMKDHVEHYNAVLAENQRKNKAITAVVETFADIKAEDVQYSFDDNRRLSISCPKLLDVQLKTAQDAIEAAIGKDQATFGIVAATP